MRTFSTFLYRLKAHATSFATAASVLALATGLGLGSAAHAAKPYATEIYSSAQLRSEAQACLGLLPQGQLPAVPNAAALRLRPLCSNSFLVLHSSVTRTPVLAVEKLTREQLLDAKGEARADEFFEDPRLKASERADLSDYRGSGYDRGHLAPAADQPDATAMAQSFALSNMVPQNPTHNRKVWSKLESDTRKYAQRSAAPVYVFTGVLFEGEVQKVGSNGVWVPSHLYKLVYDSANQRAWAQVLPNTADAQLGKPMSYAQFKQRTGLDILGQVPVRAN